MSHLIFTDFWRNEMLKKIVLGVLLLGLAGILVAGAMIRTLDKTAEAAEGRGGGRGPAAAGQAGPLAVGYGQTAGHSDGDCDHTAEPAAAEAPGLGQGEAVDWMVYEGTVVQAPGAGIDLVIETESGEEIEVGTGPGYLAGQGFVLEEGEEVRVQGYWEGGELKAAQITRLRDGQVATLRDQLGRPAWAGYGQRAQAQQAVPALGNRGGGLGQGNLGGSQAGTGQAEVDAWLAVEGVVISAGAPALVVRAGDGQETVLDGRAWRYLGEQGFQVAAGDRVRLVGFYEADRFEAGEVTNLDTGQRVLIREESGRPLWAGRGRGEG
jgi:hypothetical protein